MCQMVKGFFKRRKLQVIGSYKELILVINIIDFQW